MSSELFLFGDDSSEKPLRSPVDSPIADWQVDLIRRALDVRSLTEMDERQRVIEDAVGRPLENLRALTHHEAIRVISIIGRRASRAERSASQWDAREGETWIDRM